LIGTGLWLLASYPSALEAAFPAVCSTLFGDGYVTTLRQGQLVAATRIVGGLFIIAGCFGLVLRSQELRTKAKRVLMIVVGTGEDARRGEAPKLEASRLFLFSTLGAMAFIGTYFLSLGFLPWWVTYALYGEDLFFESLTAILFALA
ncbi:hypothetical protein ACFL2Q_19550, partial [Thermodesulfobacteriota bacterium]